MAGDIRITNCHVHCFTDRHVPRNYPHVLARPFRMAPGLLRLAAFLCRVVGQLPWADALDRLYAFNQEVRARSQAEILGRLVPQYPANTRFVVLPMDMAAAGHGPVAEDIERQHDELAALARDPKFAGRVIPFASIHPARVAAAAEVRRCIGELGFRGLKLYPRLGFDPDHPVLMKEVYPFLQERGLPVVSHCSRGGVTGKGIVRPVADGYSSPRAFIPVLRAFPRLRVCLAHFGGAEDWRAYAVRGIDPWDPAARAANWQVAIRDMIASGDYPNLWTDISYTLFHFDDNVAFLKLFLADERIARRVLFGSDYYMTRNEALSERVVCFRLRAALGEETFRRIAATNPEIWLGERAEI